MFMHALQRMVAFITTRFATFDIGEPPAFEKTDSKIKEIKRRNREVEARLRRLELQGTPRGELNG